MAPSGQARFRLFCFPSAGGAASSYRKWSSRLGHDVEILPVELPGRGSRMSEAPIRSMEALIPVLLDGLVHALDRPFALFGHSMGALIAIELAHHLRECGGVEPKALVVSGHRAPHLPDPEPLLYDQPNSCLEDELRRLGGTPAEVLEHRELLEMVLRPFRADLCITDTYRCAERPPLDVPLLVLGGLEDPKTDRHELEEWRQHSRCPICIRLFPGAHFFLHTHQDAVLRRLREELARLRA